MEQHQVSISFVEPYLSNPFLCHWFMHVQLPWKKEKHRIQRINVIDRWFVDVEW